MASNLDDLNPFLHLEQNARANPSGVFVQTVDQRILNSEALVLVRQVAYEMRRLGVKPGDRVALDLPEALSLLFTEAVFHEAATSMILPREFAADPSFTIDWMFTRATAPAGVALRTVAVSSSFLERVEQNPYGITPRSFESADSLLRIGFSSGTTGKPNAIGFELGKLASPASSREVVETAARAGGSLICLGISTAVGFGGFMQSVRNGRPFISVGIAGPAAIVDLAAQNSIAYLSASPAQIAGFVAELEAQGRTVPSIQTVFVMGTVMPPELSARMRRAADGCEIHNLYGSTEASLVSIRDYDSDDPFDAGRLAPGSIVEIVDDDDNPLPDGQVGRIRHQHPLMVHEYLGNAEATRERFRDGWFYPGDLGSIRPDGGLTLAGRSSEILNAGGVKIDPTRLDLFALSTQHIADAASFAYVNSDGLEQVGIALVADHQLDLPALVKAFAATFGAAAPQLITRVDEIPRNTMGKPMRRELTERFSGN